jgi:hypothetical protein
MLRIEMKGIDEAIRKLQGLEQRAKAQGFQHAPESQAQADPRLHREGPECSESSPSPGTELSALDTLATSPRSAPGSSISLRDYVFLGDSQLSSLRLVAVLKYVDRLVIGSSHPTTVIL